jgi:hypothetical protein
MAVTPEATQILTTPMPSMTVGSTATSTAAASQTVAATQPPNATQTVMMTSTPEATRTARATNTPRATRTVMPTRTPGSEMVTICHATGSSGNPYVQITVSREAAMHHQANHERDIVPAPPDGCPRQ